ncbi:MAG: hypothetical protein ACXU95_11155 [Isosphaeraceae bacterium]
MSKPIIRPVVTSKKRQRLRAVEGMGVSVENQSAAIPATAGKPSDMSLNAPSKLQESSPTQTLEISKTVAFRPGRIVTG